MLQPKIHLKLGLTKNDHSYYPTHNVGMRALFFQAWPQAPPVAPCTAAATCACLRVVACGLPRRSSGELAPHALLPPPRRHVCVPADVAVVLGLNMTRKRRTEACMRPYYMAQRNPPRGAVVNQRA